MNTIFSGVQPTGNLHLGNYLGAIKNWVKLQNDYNCIYCIVDLHAITVPQNPKELKNNIYETTATYIAAGIDPQKNIIFNQSQVAEHSELAWILNCHTPLGWLDRMTQFKDKSKKQQNVGLGLYAYPVLMAADILLYKTTHVPIGEDQKQHLELTRDIAGAFNRYYEQDYFPTPEPVIMGTATRVMSLRDGTSKMSKSDESGYSRINLNDDDDVLVTKIKKAKTDSIAEITYEPENRPEVSNLVNIYAAIADKTTDEVCQEFEGKKTGEFKKALAEVLVEEIAPISKKINHLLDDKIYLEKIISNGAEKAKEIAFKNMKEIKEIIGFLC